MEISRLLEFKMYQVNLSSFTRRLNENFHKNGGLEEILYSLNWNPEEIFKIQAQIYKEESGRLVSIDNLSRGMKNIYMLSLLETYSGERDQVPAIVLVEYPEMYLHP